MITGEYICSACEGVFDKGWTDEDALNEKDELFPDIPLEICKLVCEDCFKKIMTNFIKVFYDRQVKDIRA